MNSNHNCFHHSTLENAAYTLLVCPLQDSACSSFKSPTIPITEGGYSAQSYAIGEVAEEYAATDTDLQ